ncbi:MAG: hypothetical protein R3B90_10065 [Planctomycetaceae bacterium]
MRVEEVWNLGLCRRGLEVYLGERSMSSGRDAGKREWRVVRAVLRDERVCRCWRASGGVGHGRHASLWVVRFPFWF